MTSNAECPACATFGPCKQHTVSLEAPAPSSDLDAARKNVLAWEVGSGFTRERFTSDIDAYVEAIRADERKANEGRKRVLSESLAYIASGKWLDASDVLGTWSGGDILSASYRELAVMEYARRALNPENGDEKHD